MSSLRAVQTLALCAGLLAACSKPAQHGGAPNAPASGPAASSAAAGGEGLIKETDLPHPRPGQWEMIDTSQGRPSRSRFCIADRPIDVSRMRAHCQKVVFRRTLTGVAVESECGQGGVSTKMRLTAQGDFNTAYSTDMQMTFVLRPGDTPHVSQTHMDYRYVGPCPPGEAAAADQAAKGE
jgi:hypothetical protein